MPIPDPKKGQERQEFVSDCIAELTREKKDEYPDQKQRAAICYSQWDRSKEDQEKES